MSNVMKIENLNYSHNLVKILNDVNLKVESGKIIGLLGENGAGKTTLMRLITGNAHGTGAIEVSGTFQAKDRKAHVSFTDHLNGFPAGMKIGKIVDFYRTVYDDFDDKRCDDLMKFLNLDKTMKVSALSKGNKEKLIIALTLSRQVELYLLDEPFSGIDSMSRKKIINSIIQWKPEHATILVSDHYVSEIAPILDEIIVIKNETIACQKQTDEIRENKGMSVESFYESLYDEGGNNID
ncbi:ABC transporter ATP-binding protein [Companilactobacillus mishanensis]|uniref:ATP-binding cassette domain-containing protein n=1 Tax=Companilactobacillus mishanensis TaxID=2486008 RepID=UPI001295B9C4|nr:ABC transporter ATP-binding protein [Companilactobacillus mishanensis]MQS89603.1 ABC transporter ATP-binding protein [Companilactobacillus mishanensis]